MFMGPFEQMIPWDTKGVVGCRRFIEKIYNLSTKSADKTVRSLSTKPDLVGKSGDLKRSLHKTIKKVSEDIELMKFNTAVSSEMQFVNTWQASNEILEKKDLSDFLKILSPFAPHLAEELWNNARFKELCCQQKWPKYDEKLIEEEKVTLVVMINSKVRDKIEMESGVEQAEVEKIVLVSEKIKALLNGAEIKKIIFVPNKLINIVI